MPPRGGGGGDGDGDGSSGDDKVLGLTARALYSRYQGLLSRAPLVTKSVSAGLITLLGDVIAQWLESRIEGYYGWNVVRMAAFTVAGGFFVGPFVHYWYEVLWAVGRRLPANTPSKLTTLLQVFLDQTIGVALFFPAYFYVYEACEALFAFRRPMPSVATSKIRADLGSILVNQYKVWPFINFVSFSMVPEQLRVLFSNLASVFWNIYLCSQVGT
ncbi:hypothetical protein TrRE_jg3083 [Triparma retinervis]|uniref:Uncharacterized protein n=1 Tax=Triparma retinervis TaxID=2557542 RepID=A0A9W7FEG2_9STRA|nr:hypothetical protein TrRE_jg3083 [Triparma retinervis]